MPDNYNYDAVVVGSGPNGLAAAITIAREGHSVLVLEGSDSIGGGLRSQEIIEPNHIHDICAAVHPMALASPFFQLFPLEDYGVEWAHSPISLAHPLDDGTAVVLKRSVEETAAQLGQDAESYRRLMIPLVNKWDHLVDGLLRPFRLPRHPLTMARFGSLAVASPVGLIKSRFREESAAALFAGLFAHSILPLDRWGGVAYGIMLGMAGHAVGWPVARGGSQTIASAMASCLESLGGEIRTNCLVESMKNIPAARAILFDLTPRQLLHINGLEFPDKFHQKLQKYRYGPGVFKMDWILDGPVPWKVSDCAQSATVHLGGSLGEIAEAESQVWKGRHPDQPLVILVQPSAFDATRAPNGKHVLWAYCHVPNGSDFDMSHRIEAQIERFAPGFQERIIGRHMMSPVAMETYNPNYVGGDIAGGENDLFPHLIKPLGSWQPYRTPNRGIYICSASMPPGGGIHGMCGFHAAKTAIKDMF